MASLERLPEARPQLELVSSGDGGVEELQASIQSDAEVLWALLRVSLGSGSFARSKVVLIHFNGEDSPAVRRACDNALANDVKQALRRGGDGGDCFHACIELNRAAEVTEERVLKMVSEFFIVDHVGEFNSSWCSREHQHDLTTEFLHLENRSRRPSERFGRGKLVGRSASDLPPTSPGEDHQDGSEIGGRQRHRQRRASDSISSTSGIGLHWKQQGRTTPIGDSRDALKSVSQDGPWNWVLLGPDPSKLPLFGSGSGSFEELKGAAEEHSDSVAYALLRLQFGIGRLRRTKFVFLHLIGEEVPAVRRGRENAVRPAMESALKEFATWSVSFLDMTASRLFLAEIIDRVRQVSVIDDSFVAGDRGTAGSLFSLEAYEEALRNEQALAAAGQAPLNKDSMTPMSETPSLRRRFFRSTSRLSEGRRSLNGSSSSLEGFETLLPGSAPYGPDAAEREVEDVLQLLQYEQTRNWALFRCRAPRAARRPSGSLNVGNIAATATAAAASPLRRSSSSSTNSATTTTTSTACSSSSAFAPFAGAGAGAAGQSSSSSSLLMTVGKKRGVSACLHASGLQASEGEEEAQEEQEEESEESEESEGRCSMGGPEKQYEAVDETPMAARGSLKDRALRFEKAGKMEA